MLKDPAHTNAPDPSLDARRLKVVRHEDSEKGVLEAYVPATPPEISDASGAPALLCVPGLGMDGNCFQRQLPLAGRTDLHFLRPPAYAAQGEEGLGHFAHYVERYIRRLNLERRGVVLLGSSMGGVVSLLVATRRNVKLRGLIVVGSYGHHRHLCAYQRRLARTSWVLPVFLIPFFAGPMLRKTSTFGRFAREEAKFMQSCIHIPSRGYLTRATHTLRKLDLLDAARNLKLPTLVLHGTDDRVLPLDAGRELAQTIPNARLQEIPNAGHAVFFLDHEPVNAAVSEFTGEVSNARE